MKMNMTLKITFTAVCVLLLAQTGYADKVYLKNGKVLDGTIIENQPNYIKIKIGVAPYKYYRTQIDRIQLEGEPVIYSVSAEKLIKKYDMSLYFDAISEEKVSLILEMLIADQTVQGLEVALEQSLKQVPAGNREQILEVLNIEDMLSNAIPIYDKYYSEQELKDMITFFYTPSGQAFIKKAKQVNQETAKSTFELIKGKLDSQ